MDARADKTASRRPLLAPRDPERTRATILAAATAEFSRKGLDGARVDEIARRSGVNKRMIYHYFGDKRVSILPFWRRAIPRSGPPSSS